MPQEIIRVKDDLVIKVIHLNNSSLNKEIKIDEKTVEQEDKSK